MDDSIIMNMFVCNFQSNLCLKNGIKEVIYISSAGGMTIHMQHVKML